jgi:hypothetical protein
VIDYEGFAEMSDNVPETSDHDGEMVDHDAETATQGRGGG